jgi:hypothetical protein
MDHRRALNRRSGRTGRVIRLEEAGQGRSIGIRQFGDAIGLQHEANPRPIPRRSVPEAAQPNHIIAFHA